MNVLLTPRYKGMYYSLAALLMMVLLTGLTRLQTEANYRVYFDADDPLLVLQQSVDQRFRLDDTAVMIVEAGAEPLWAEDKIEFYRQFEQTLLALPFVTRVSGFYQFVDGYGLSERSALTVDDPFAEVVDEVADVPRVHHGAYLQQHPVARDLVSADGRFAVIEVQVDLPPGDSARQVQRVMSEIRDVAERLRVEGALGGITYSGVLALNEAYIDVVRHDLRVFVPSLLLLMAALLFSVLRSWRLVMLPLMSGLLVAAMALGAAGWASWTLAAINAFIPIIIISLHLAASMHLVVNWLQRRAAGLASLPAMEASLAFNRGPMLLSAVTTAAGFLLLVLSPSPPVRVVGFCVAIGVALSLLVNLLLLPLLLTRFALPESRVASLAARLSLEPLVPWLRAQRRWVLWFAALISVLALAVIGKAEINDNVYSYFPADNAFSQGTVQLDQYFTGCVRLSYVLKSNSSGSAVGMDASTSGAVWQPEFQALQEGFTAWLLAQPEVYGVSDAFGLMHRFGMNAEQAQQLLQQRSITELGLSRIVTQDLSSTRIEVALRALSSRELIAFDGRAQQWLSANRGNVLVEGGSGPDLIFAWLGQRNAQSMFVSLGLALLGIGLLLGVLFRDPILALLGVVCNVLPLLLVYALWFAAGGYISLGAAVVMGMIMGVVVDDTLHLLCKYRGFSLAGHRDPVLAVSRQVLPTVVITSITLALGLAIGVFSDFRPLRELGLLSAAVILAAMLVDAVLLPVLLMYRSSRGDTDRKKRMSGGDTVVSHGTEG